VPSALTRLTLRRERRSILAWSLGGGCLTLYCILMFNTMYATAEERQGGARTPPPPPRPPPPPPRAGGPGRRCPVSPARNARGWGAAGGGLGVLRVGGAFVQ